MLQRRENEKLLTEKFSIEHNNDADADVWIENI